MFPQKKKAYGFNAPISPQGTSSSDDDDSDDSSGGDGGESVFPGNLFSDPEILAAMQVSTEILIPHFVW